MWQELIRERGTSSSIEAGAIEEGIVTWHIIIAPNALLMGVGCGNDGYWRDHIPVHLCNVM